VVLDSHEVLVVLKLDNLHTLGLVVLSNKVQSSLAQLLDVLGVNLVSVTVTLEDLSGLSVKLTDLGPLRTRLEDGRADSETHSSSKVGGRSFRHEDNDGVGGLRRDLNRVCVLQSTDVTGVLNDRNLHSQANSQVGNVVLSGPLGSRNHTLSTTSSEPSGNQDTLSGTNIVPGLVELGRVGSVGGRLQSLSLNPNQVQLAATAHGGVLERLDNGKVGVVQVGVLSNKGDSNGVEETVLAEGKGLPLLPEVLALLNVCGGGVELVEMEGGGKLLGELLLVQKDGNVVGGVNVVDGDDLLVVDVTEEGDLLDGSGVEGLGATTSNLSQLSASFSKF
jgi:hypothetical protein